MKFHPKHGVNPTMKVCFWCDKPTGEIALLGDKYKGEAPRYMVVDYSTCKECEDRWKQGVVMLEVKTTPVDIDQQPIQENLYPTGNHLVIPPEALQNEYKAGDVTLVTSELFQELINKKGGENNVEEV